MKTFYKPTLFISACIEHLECRYDGTIIRDEHVKRLKEVCNVITACPEIAIGLPTPRDALRLVMDKETKQVSFLTTLKGEDYTKEMTEFSKEYSHNLKNKDVDGFILKAKSPSCGISSVKMYYGLGKSHAVSGKNPGIFGGQILEDYTNVPIENERRLSNYNIREKFYTKLFTLSEFKQLKNDFSYKKLVQFHSDYKYLYMTYHQGILRTMGQIVANPKKLPHQTVLLEYENQLHLLFEKEPTKEKRINVLTHIYGYFKKDLSDHEKAYYFDAMDDYLNNKTPYSNLTSILYTYALRFNQTYLLSQTIFMPYPKELIQMLDSGKQT
jgi:uncharacterized protein YbbK (DUF523 family)/uncharacterized protein YbgA (DUF1722 family)